MAASVLRVSLAMSVLGLGFVGCGEDEGAPLDGGPLDSGRDQTAADAAARDAPPSDGGGADSSLPAPDGGLDEGRADSATSMMDGGHDGASTGPDGNDPTCPPSPPPPTGACDIPDLVCAYADGDCYCLPPCSGVPPPDVHEWQCEDRPAACPDTAPIHGSPCGQEGLRCEYGTCGVIVAECRGSQWQITELPPPP